MKEILTEHMAGQVLCAYFRWQGALLETAGRLRQGQKTVDFGLHTGDFGAIMAV